jgi:hypothetical protein
MEDILDIMAMARDIGASQDCHLISGLAEAIDIAIGKHQDLRYVPEVCEAKGGRSSSNRLSTVPTCLS